MYPIVTKTDFFNRAGYKGKTWFAQRPVTVAKAIVRGIKKEKKKIYPLRSFVLMMIDPGRIIAKFYRLIDNLF